MTALVGAELYDALYATGYHDNLNTTRSGEVIGYMANTTHTALYGVHKVLDLGCSHGFAVSTLWDLGYVASGVDISQIAVEKARKARGEPEGKCVSPCFAQGPATRLPWPTLAFDAVMSSDVLEHVEPADVLGAVRELSRVASRMLVLKIARAHDSVDGKQVKAFEKHKNVTQHHTGAGKALYDHSKALPGDLHPSAHSPGWWIDHFRTVGGWEMHHNIPTPHGRPWLCCSFVLQRNMTVAEARSREMT